MTDDVVAVRKPAGMPVHVAGQYRKNTVAGVLQVRWWGYYRLSSAAAEPPPSIMSASVVEAVTGSLSPSAGLT